MIRNFGSSDSRELVSENGRGLELKKNLNAKINWWYFKM